MIRPLRRLIAPAAPLLLPILLGACSGGRDQPGAVSADDARQLNDAAAMLDANSVDVNAVATVDQEQP